LSVSGRPFKFVEGTLGVDTLKNGKDRIIRQFAGFPCQLLKEYLPLLLVLRPCGGFKLFK
jgi:hypothetical protein